MVAGRILFYWVDFDTPQVDADGDGPYTGGEIIETALEVACPPSPEVQKVRSDSRRELQINVWSAPNAAL